MKCSFANAHDCHVSVVAFACSITAGLADLEPLEYKDPAPAPSAGDQLVAFEDFDCSDSEEEHELTEKDAADDKLESAEAKPRDHHGGEHVHVPASFFQRECYVMLSEEGLTCVPSTEGLRLSHHTQSQQWHAMWTVEGKTRNFAPSWGQKRSEAMSLLLSLRQLWLWHLTICEDDHAGQAQLDKIQAKIKGVEF